MILLNFVVFAVAAWLIRVTVKTAMQTPRQAEWDRRVQAFYAMLAHFRRRIL